MKIINKIIESKWIKNVSYVFLGKCIAMGFLQLFDIVIARKLTIQAYSEWAYFFSILSILFYVGWLGVNVSSKVYISKAENFIVRDKYIKAALCVRLTVSIIITVLILVFAPVIASLLGYPDKYPNLLFLIFLAAFIVFVNSYVDFFKNVYQAVESFELMSVATTIEYVGYFLFACVFICIRSDVRMVALAYLTANIVTLAYNGSTLIKKLDYHKVDLVYEKAKEIFRYAIPMAFISMGCVLLAEIDIVMLGIFGTKADVSIYSISKHISDKATHVNEALITGTITSFAIVNSENINKKMEQFKKIERINIFASLITSVLLAVIGFIGIPLFYGEIYKGASIIMYMLIPYYILFGISNLYARMLDYQGGAWKRSVWFISALIINIVCNYIMIPIWGAYGAAVSTIISLVPYTIYTIVALKRLFRKFQIHGFLK